MKNRLKKLNPPLLLPLILLAVAATTVTKINWWSDYPAANLAGDAVIAIQTNTPNGFGKTTVNTLSNAIASAANDYTDDATNGTVAKAVASTHSTNFWGQLSPTNWGNGTGANASTFARGDGSWSTVSEGSATNVVWPTAGTGTTATTNGLEVAINADVTTTTLEDYWPKTVDVVTNNAPSVSVTNLTVYGTASFQGSESTSSFDTVRVTNSMTAGTIVGQGNGITNTSGYSLVSMADTNWVLQQVSSYGLHVYTSGTTNTGALGGRTNNWQGWSTPVLDVTTNALSGMAQNDYIRTTVSTQTVVRVGDGPISISAYLFKGAVGTILIHPEFYLYDTVGETLVEIGAASAQSIASGAPARYTWSISVGSTNLTNPNKIVWSWKVDSLTATPTLNFVSGGAYDTHLTFAENIASATIQASQIVGGGNLIFSNAATARVDMATNAAWATNWTGSNALFQAAQAMTNGTVAAAVTNTGTIKALQVEDDVYYDNTNMACANFQFHYWVLNTNDAVVFNAPTNVVTTGSKVQWCVLLVTNTAGSLKPLYRSSASVFTNGVWNVTNSSVVTFYNWAGRKTNAICLPIN